MPSYSALKGLKAGTVGGLVGAVILVGRAPVVAMGQEVFYVTIGKKLGLGDGAVVGGWTLHFVVRLVAGAVFLATTGLVRMFSLTSAHRGLWVGAIGGAVVWIVVYVPVTGILVPADLIDQTFASGSFTPRVFSSANNFGDDAAHCREGQHETRVPTLICCS